MVASHAGDFRGARISSLPTRDEIRASLKTPAWKANMMVERVNRSLRCYSRGSDFFFSKKIIFVTKCRIQNHVICRSYCICCFSGRRRKCEILTLIESLSFTYTANVVMFTLRISQNRTKQIKTAQKLSYLSYG